MKGPARNYYIKSQFFSNFSLGQVAFITIEKMFAGGPVKVEMTPLLRHRRIPFHRTFQPVCASRDGDSTSLDCALESDCESQSCWTRTRAPSYMNFGLETCGLGLDSDSDRRDLTGLGRGAQIRINSRL